MPIIREYLVSFNKAIKQPSGNYAIAFEVGKRSEDHTVRAATLPDLEQQVRRLAQAFGATCSPYIRMATKAARKPPGFDAWKKPLHIIEFAAPLTVKILDMTKREQISTSYPRSGIRMVGPVYPTPDTACEHGHEAVRTYVAADTMGNFGHVCGVAPVEGGYRAVINTYHSNT